MGTLKRDKYKPKKTNEIKLKKFIQKIKIVSDGDN